MHKCSFVLCVAFYMPSFEIFLLAPFPNTSYPRNMEGALINVLIFWMLTTPHEFAHAWVAMKLGDDTPVLEGRVTLNPLAHVDWLGTVILPLIVSLSEQGFIGWGKPVNTNPHRLRWGLNGMALVALAGPASNVIF